MSDAPSTDPIRLQEDGDSVTIEVTVAAPVETVWEHLRDPALISRWHGWVHEEDGGLDGEIDLIHGQARERPTSRTCCRPRAAPHGVPRVRACRRGGP